MEHFGPCDGRYNRDYNLSVVGRTLLYRPCSGCVHSALRPGGTAPATGVGDKMTCDWTLYERMMRACDTLRLPRIVGAPVYYAEQSGAPVASIRYHGAPRAAAKPSPVT